MSTVFGPDPVSAAIDSILAALEDGRPIDDSVERRWVDLKEEAGRRGPRGEVLPGRPSNEAAAKKLTAAAACMSNSPGGGALIVGVANDGALIGTALDSEWVRERIWQLSGRQLTVDIAETTTAGVRLLVIKAPQAIEPIRVSGQIRWRVGTSCTEVDAATWHARRMSVLNYDWSADESQVPVEAVRPAALERARELLRDSGDAHCLELADETNTNLLRRLNVVTRAGLLTNAGVIAFVGRGDPSLDYIRRARAGGDALSRVSRPGRSLLEELSEAFQAVDANTPTRHLSKGLVIAQYREIPLRAAREAIVNGVAHREWGASEPTVIEHIGGLLRVTSPGGFVGGVTATNIITHPSRSRNKALAELLAALRIAEREGVGVDRMVLDMVSAGHAAPAIEEIEGPYVRTSLVGDSLDWAWITWLQSITPEGEADDLNNLLILRHLTNVGWVDATTVAPLIQDTIAVARGALQRLSRLTLGRTPLIVPTEGIPNDCEPAWHLHGRSLGELQRLGEDLPGPVRRWPSREAVAASYAKARGRISSTELASLVNADPTNMGPTLKSLEQDGLLEPAWPSRRGRGFFYRLVGGTSPEGVSRSRDGGTSWH